MDSYHRYAVILGNEIIGYFVLVYNRHMLYRIMYSVTDPWESATCVMFPLENIERKRVGSWTVCSSFLWHFAMERKAEYPGDSEGKE